MIYCKALAKEFPSKRDMFKALRAERDKIIEQKRAKIYNTDCTEAKGSIRLRALNASHIEDGASKDLFSDESYYYIAVNTTSILDSHEDVHIKGLWNKSVKEQQGKLYLVADHDFRSISVIVRKEHIQVFTADIPFSALKQPYEGSTEALIYKFKKDAVANPVFREWLDSGDEIQASVRMQYVKLIFAMNSEDEEDKEFKANYDRYIGEIANAGDFEGGIDYFYPVVEAKNVLESSLVLLGSNHATGAINPEPGKTHSGKTGEAEPSKKGTPGKSNFYHLMY